MAKITATINTVNGDVTKTFNAEIRVDRHIYCPELIEWVTNAENRTSNYIDIEMDNKKYLYCL